MYINWKKTIIVTLDLVLVAYIALAVTSFNKPDHSSQVCKKVSIRVADADSSGFLSAGEIKRILVNKNLYPDGKSMEQRGCEGLYQGNINSASRLLSCTSK